MLEQNKNRRYTLGKTERLKSTKVIQSLFLKNQTLKAFPFKLVYLIEPSTQSFSQKVGVTVSKRQFKHAVTRNLIKRRMRECIRLNKSLLDEKLNHQNITLAYMLVYSGAEILPYKVFDTKIKQLLMRLGDKLNSTLHTDL